MKTWIQKRIKKNYWLVGIVQRFHWWIHEFAEEVDVCHICGEPAAYWCESCDKRHCIDHEARCYSDVDCCVKCAPTKEEMQAEWDALTEEEKVERADL